eukprot:Clim_evm5s12 gene=Clim_evmTU5s12
MIERRTALSAPFHTSLDPKKEIDPYVIVETYKVQEGRPPQECMHRINSDPSPTEVKVFERLNEKDWLVEHEANITSQVRQAYVELTEWLGHRWAAATKAELDRLIYEIARDRDVIERRREAERRAQTENDRANPSD